MAERRFSREIGSPLVVAHRGASGHLPENTLPAFEAAIAAGAGAVEFDVRISLDGHPIVIHDPTVDRTTDGGGLVRDLTLSDLKRLRTPASSGEVAEIPTLAETLELLSGRAAVDIEIKNLPGEPDHEPERERAVDATIRALEESGFVGAVLISSFNPRSIARAREMDRGMPTGLLSIEAMPASDALSVALDGGHGWMLPAVGALLAVGRGLVARAHEAGVQVGTWIVDDAELARELAAWDVDALATNDPAGIVVAIAADRR
jgi:glycerophosphoryl diester phosphodiesterase